MVASADGRATLAGKSGGLSNEADRELFHALREQVDAVLVGTGTLRAERYGPFVRDPERRARREAAGLGARPDRMRRHPQHDAARRHPAVRRTRARRSPSTRPSDAEPPDVAARLEVTRLPAERLTMTGVLERLRADHGVRSVLCEGGPTVLGALLGEGLVDELFLSLAPCLVGGHGLSVVEGPELPEPAELNRAWVLESRGRALPALPRETVK